MRTSWQSIVAFLVGASIALIVAWASADAAFAQSKKSKSRVENQPSQSSQQDGTKQQLPAQQPPIVNVQPIEKTDAERAEEAEDRRRKATLDALLTQYTGKLAQFTEWLFIATVGLAAATIGLLVAWRFPGLPREAGNRDSHSDSDCRPEAMGRPTQAPGSWTARA
jgi:hypothetical protein